MDTITGSPLASLALVAGARSTFALSQVLAVGPRSERWTGRRDRPWGLGDDFRFPQSSRVRDLETIRIGKVLIWPRHWRGHRC